MAHKKAGGSTKNGRDSHSKRLGLKKFGGEQVLAGNILVRQRGTVYRAGDNVGIGTDHTLALSTGVVRYRRKGVGQRVHVSVDPQGDAPQSISRQAPVSRGLFVSGFENKARSHFPRGVRWKFVDEASIKVQAGNGGRGKVSCREKFVLLRLRTARRRRRQRVYRRQRRAQYARGLPLSAQLQGRQWRAGRQPRLQRRGGDDRESSYQSVRRSTT